MDDSNEIDVDATTCTKYNKQYANENVLFPSFAQFLNESVSDDEVTKEKVRASFVDEFEDEPEIIKIVGDMAIVTIGKTRWTCKLSSRGAKRSSWRVE
jgi:hypothetical protein